MVNLMRKGLPGGGCPCLHRQPDLEGTLVPAYCRNPVSILSTVPGFWEYWNRCTTVKHIRCLLYRRHRRRSHKIGLREGLEHPTTTRR